MANFFIRTVAEKGKATLYVRVRKLKLNWTLSTGVSVDVIAWRKNYESGNAKLWDKYTSEGGAGADLKKKMDKISDTINLLFKEKRIKSAADKKVLVDALFELANADGIKAREEIEQMERESEEKRLRTIWAYYDYFFSGISNGTITKGKNEKYKQSSVKVWRDFGKHMKNYTPQNMTFEEITKRFADGFSNYLEGLGFMGKTVNKYVMCFRKLCNAAAVDEKNKSASSLKVWKERSINDADKRTEIALNDAEVNALYNMKLSGTREGVRDVWCLGFFCGQRLSDYSKLSRENFHTTENGTQVIAIRQQKTGIDTLVPIIDDRVFELCEKYDYTFPKFDDRVFDKQIKNVVRELSQTMPSLRIQVTTALTMPERRKEMRYLSLKKRVDAGEKLIGYEKKSYIEMKRYADEHCSGDMLYKRDYAGRAIKERWELVGSHTSRRSAITSLYNTGLFDAKEIMSISGHRTLTNYENYIRRGAQEQAERIAEKARKAKEIRLQKEA